MCPTNQGTAKPFFLLMHSWLIRSEGGKSNLVEVIFAMQGGQNVVGDLSQATQEFLLLPNVKHNLKSSSAAPGSWFGWCEHGAS